MAGQIDVCCALQGSIDEWRMMEGTIGIQGRMSQCACVTGYTQ